MSFNAKKDFNLTDDIRSIERKFYRFYLKVINDYFDLDEKFLTNIISNYGNKTQNINNVCVFSNPGDLFLMCIQDTCFALRKINSFLLEYEEFGRYLLKKNLITVYCATGESGFSALGLCTVIDESIGQYGLSHNRNTKQIELIIIDESDNWRSLCSFIIESINSCYKNVKIELTFMKEHFSRLTSKFFGTIKEVDIVVMARYLSKFSYIRVRTDFYQVVLNRMKELSILFYMDENNEIYYNTLKFLISKTDSLVEIMNETVYETFDVFENTEYDSEFRFLRNATFKRVMFSTCIKFCGIKDNNTVNNIKCVVSSLNESGSLIKQILERIKKENKYTSHASEIKYLRVPETNAPKKSMIKNVEKSSKNTQRSNIYPLKSQIATFSQKNATRLLEGSTEGNLLLPSIPVQSTQNTGIPKANTAFEKFQNSYKYVQEKNKLNDETLKTSKHTDKFVSKNPRKKRKKSRRGNKTSIETVQTNKPTDKSAVTNLQNKHKYSKTGKISNVETVKASKVPEKPIAINQQNKKKQLNMNKQNAETTKASNVVSKSASKDLKMKKKSSGIKANAGTIKKNKIIGMLVTMNLRSKYTYSEEETASLSVDKHKARKISQKLSSTKLESNNSYKSPHLSTEQSLSMYVNHLSDIYYSKHFDKCKPRTQKLK